MKRFSIDFFKNRYKFFAVSISIMIIGFICNVCFGTRLDMQFTGGTIVKYSYNGTINESDITTTIASITEKNVSISFSENLSENSSNIMAITFSGTDAISLDQQKSITEALNEKLPDNELSLLESSSIDANMGKTFFVKCLACIAIAFIILIFYIAFRFKKIGGMSAGVMAIIALLHDITMVYLTFIITKTPLNDNFIAVVLTILGYSLIDTIIIYDRIRENKTIPEHRNMALDKVVNLSINQTLSRSINTSVSTFLSIAIVFVVGSIYGITSITTFALPMMIGIVTGCYSSICIAGPLYVMWQNHKSSSTTKKA